MKFLQYLDAVAKELVRIKADANAFQVRHDQDPLSASCLISVGFGRQRMDDSERDGVFAVALNNKLRWGGHWTEGELTSVSRLVSGAPPAASEHWRNQLRVSEGDLSLANLSLAVEDASPDSCLGLLSFMATMAGVDPTSVPPDWISFVDDWERGLKGRRSELPTYGELHSAVVHAHISTDIRAAWIAGLELMTACLLGDCDPRAIPAAPREAVTARALANVRFEETEYENVRHALPKLQLVLPLASNPTRRMLVDALLAEERVLMGAHSVYLRADREHSFLGRGFTLFVLHRPELRGDGNDFTISLDPTSGLSLVDLWKALERAEDAAWQGKRPNDSPDKRLSSYPEGKRRGPDGKPTQENSPNQPWYHDPDFTLVGAPKRLADGTVGSRLSWDEVLETLWRCYSPFRDTRVIATAQNMSLSRKPEQTELSTIEACPSETSTGSNRRVLKLGRHHRPDNATPPLMWSPTLGSYLATSLLRRSTADREVSAREVLEGPPHTQLVVENGIMVVSARGAYVLESDVGRGFDLGSMSGVFANAAKVMDWVEDNTQRVSELVDVVRRQMAGEAPGRTKGHLGTYNEICALQLEILNRRHRLDTATTDKLAQMFEELIITNWGVLGRLDELYRDLDEVKVILTSHGELVTNRRIAILTFFGFPIVLAASLFSFVFSEQGVHLVGLLGFVAFSALGVAIMFAVSWVGNKQAHLSGGAVDSKKGGGPATPR